MSDTAPSRASRATPQPSNADLATWATTVLAGHGLTRPPDGYRVEDLAAVADAHNWGHATEHRPTTHLDRRWKATVYPLDVPNPQPWITGGKTGSATNEADALAIALARMLEREEREEREAANRGDAESEDAARAG
jgi:hypothetical protein